jgi:dihydropteroate synthase
MSLREPKVMGIVNVTPDSFYADSRTTTERAVADRVAQIVAEGGSIVDVGACSTRPDSMPADEATEMERLRLALSVVRRVASDAVVSVDTFRPDVARMAVEEYGADIINDVGGTSGGAALTADKREDMFRMVSRLHVPYIYMSAQADIRQILLECAAVVDRLRSLGQKDIVIDPGFGFGKTMADNYAVMQQLQQLGMLRLPVLAGVSRKSMIWKLLKTDSSQALNGTTVLNTVALLKGASILRVHDVKEAVEAVTLVKTIEKGEACFLNSE